jgi:hypothetical protein
MRWVVGSIEARRAPPWALTGIQLPAPLAPAPPVADGSSGPPPRLLATFVLRQPYSPAWLPVLALPRAPLARLGRAPPRGSTVVDRGVELCCGGGLAVALDEGEGKPADGHFKPA